MTEGSRCPALEHSGQARARAGGAALRRAATSWESGQPSGRPPDRGVALSGPAVAVMLKQVYSCDIKTHSTPRMGSLGQRAGEVVKVMHKFAFYAMQLPVAICFIVHMQEQRLPPVTITSKSQTRPQARWNVPFGTAKRGLKAMREDGIQWSTELERTVLRFVYVKNVFEFSTVVPNTISRRLVISSLLRPPETPTQDFSKFARTRLFRLFTPESDVVSKNSIPANVMSFAAFLRYHSAWGGPDSYIFLEDDSWKWRILPRQRVQESSLCYMHAPVVLQSYLISWNSRNAEIFPECEMLDIRRYILENFSPENLRDHIIRDEGGHSLDYLQSILEPGSKVFHADSTDMISPELIKNFGPALVYQFKVYEDFKLPGRLSYLEKPSDEFIGRHSMVLIGVRTEGDRKVFLLQNWWRKKQFIEVSDTYLMACDARVAFVQTPQTRLPADLQSRYTVYAETADLDKMDTLWPETARSGGSQCAPSLAVRV